jgi:FkbM family methyltransferase
MALNFFLRFPRLFGAVEARRSRPNLDRLTYLRLIKRGHHVLDVGANIGVCTHLFSRLVGSKGAVHSFEPSSATHTSLGEMIEASGCKNVTAHRTGLGNFEGTAELITPGSDHGQSSFHQHSASSWETPLSLSRQTVPVSTLDGFVESFGIGRIDFIKVDTEGNELHFIEGGKASLRRFRPLVYMELNDKWLFTACTSASAVVDAMRSAGFSHVYRPAVPRSGTFSLEPADLASPVNGDFLFCPRATSV